MALEPGTVFGSYEVVEQIGSGGMGEVYRATDTKLGRDVAIKTLPAALADDEDRLARFEREAKLLAALNHPHIAGVFSLDSHDGTLYIAMELVEGETLEQKLAQGDLPLDDALRLALQIAEALEAAHDKGVIHRDLKPANVMVTADGIVKVLDFGLAKAFSDDPNQASAGHSPALSLAMTQAGLVLGTAGYMSPEQASGQATDQRADIWSFGVVLYEMLTGLPLFSGESVPHILADVLKTEPDWNRLPENLHPRLRLMLERCLTKKPRNRYHSIADARVDIQVALNDPNGLLVATSADVAVPVVPVWRRALIPLAATIGGALAAGVTVWYLVAPAAGPVNRFDFELEEGQRFNNLTRAVVAMSPTGRHFVYATPEGLALRRMDVLEPQLIDGSDADPNLPFFSPDGQFVGYAVRGDPATFRKISVNGGAPVIIGEFTEAPYGASWGLDDNIYYAAESGIWRVPAAGGTPELIIEATDNESLHGPRLLPDRDHLLFTVASDRDWDNGLIVAQSLATGERIVLVQGGADARYVPTGHLVYAFEDDLYRVDFDIDTMTVTPGAAPAIQGVARAISTGAANFDFSADGTLIYVPLGAAGLASGQDGFALGWLGFDGGVEPVPYPEYRDPRQMRLSPDGSRLAFSEEDRDGNRDIYVLDLERPGTPTRITRFDGNDYRPIWMPDGESLIYYSERDGGGLYRRAADATGPEQRLVGLPADYNSLLPLWADAENSELVFVVNAPDPGEGIWRASLDGAEEPTPLIDEPDVFESFASLSPDSRWLAYDSNETGASEIYISPYPDVGSAKEKVSTNGGREPVWGPDGAALYFLDPVEDVLMQVAIETNPVLRPGTPQPVADVVNGANRTQRPNFDFDPARQRFLVRMRPGASGDPEQELEILVVQNWFEEIR